jgi:hypothetical protein
LRFAADPFEEWPGDRGCVGSRHEARGWFRNESKIVESSDQQEL